MRLLKATVIALMLCCSGPVSAKERELASEGDTVRITIPDNYRCGVTAPIKVTTQSADYFEKGALDVQKRIALISGAILGFECPKIQTLEISGYTDGVMIFSANAKSSESWAIETAPAPLEKKALFLSLREPSFFVLGGIDGELKPYENVTGFKETYQYNYFEEQARRFATVIDGNLENFKSYLTDPGYDLGSFEEALSHFRSILNSIERYKPDQFLAYKAVYDEVSDNLKDQYWSSRARELLDNPENTISESLYAADNAAKNTNTADFVNFLDERSNAWLSERIQWIEQDLAEAPLFEVQIAQDILKELPPPEKVTQLSTTASFLTQKRPILSTAVQSRLTALEDIAFEASKAAGSDYDEVDSIIETAYTLSEEFEEAGFTENANNLVARSVSYIEIMLADRLPAYEQYLNGLQFDAETATALQQQALVFEELSVDFEGFAAYQKMTDDSLKLNKTSICEGILKNTSASSSDFQKIILVGDEEFELSTLACDLYENGHIVTKFSKGWTPGLFTLGIQESEGDEKHFQLKADNVITGQNLKIQSRLGEEETPISSDDWADYISRLLVPPPSGKPDAKGIRECDRLAADPNDPNRLGQGVDLVNGDIDLDTFDRAIDACIAAVEDDPNDVRQQYQLGRLLWVLGDHDTAGEYIELAASADYAPAIFYKAEMLFANSDDPDAFIDALDLFEKAGKLGYAPGAAMVKELNPEGLDFFKEIPRPTNKQMLAAISSKRKGKTISMFGISASSKMVDVKVNDCFQTSANEFSCEYKPILRCGMSGLGNDPMARLMSQAMQADCNSVYPKFSTFRKLSDGKWKEIPSK